jgi:putative GTP pyrophosphokinase
VPEISNTTVDRLGDRLRAGSRTAQDLTLLASYRDEFEPAYETVAGIIRQEAEVEVTGRPAKSTTAIVRKLKRESIRLSQIQDIAGCRIIVQDVVEQNKTLEILRGLFPDANPLDRRIHPSHGYRAIHLVPRVNGRPVEIQLRSELQHFWAEFSEVISDLSDPEIKYGGGPEEVREGLVEFSNAIERAEADELELDVTLRTVRSPESEEQLRRRRELLEATKAKMRQQLQALRSRRK